MVEINYKKIIRGFLFITGILFLIILTTKNWSDIKNNLSKTNYFFFIISVFIAILGNLLTSAFFKIILNKNNIDISFNDTNKIYFYSQIAKYIPGKIWVIIYQNSLLKNNNQVRNVLISNIEITGLLLLFTLTISSVIILYTTGELLIILFIFTVEIMLIFFIIKTDIIKKTIHKLTPKKHFDDSKENNLIKKTLLYKIAFTSTYLLSNYLLLYSIFGFSVVQSFNYIAFMGIAWVAGVIVFLVPAGIGIKETVFIILTNLLDPSITIETLTSIAVISRIWSIIQEIIGAIIIFLYNKIKPNETI